MSRERASPKGGESELLAHGHSRVREENSEREFEAFYQHHFDAVVRAVSLVSGSTVDAFDTTQEAFARTWAHWPRVVTSEHPILYTLAIARNLWRHDLRRRLKFRHSLELLRPETVSSPPDDSVDLRLAVEEAVRRLPGQQRWAVVLCDLVGLSSNEAASIMRSSPSTVRVHLTRGRQRLRRALSAVVPSE